MAYNRFFFNVLLRVLLVTGLSLLIGFLFPRPDLLFTQLILVLVMIGLVAEMTWFINRTNLDLSRFLASIKDRDFTVVFNEAEAGTFGKLGRSFNDLVSTLRDVETKSAAQAQFLSSLVDQIDFGIICFDEDDHISLMNRQASGMLDLPRVADWRKLRNPNVSMLEQVIDLPEGRNQLVEVELSAQKHTFSVHSSQIVIQEHRLRIISFQDIKSEIQQKEIEAWHKLIRILTHEIMNSVTPLVSLTDTMRLILSDEENGSFNPMAVTEPNVRDIYEAIGTIKDQSESLLRFVSNYRRLTRVPNPEIQLTKSEELVNGVLKLLQTEIAKKGIMVNAEIRPTDLFIDSGLIGQVLINLIKNAMEALIGVEGPEIRLKGEHEDGFYLLSVADNGSGIDTDKVDQIFVPFFTTKKDGSGIGLGLSRQIVSLHGGQLQLRQTSPKGSTFHLLLPLRKAD